MLQVKDPQEVFDENLLPHIKLPEDISDEKRQVILGHYYSIFVLGEIYGTISICLAQNIPIPKELWDMPVVKSFVRGDVDDVVEVDTINPKPLIENKGLIIVP
jgi:hypothetical protein